MVYVRPCSRDENFPERGTPPNLLEVRDVTLILKLNGAPYIPYALPFHSYLTASLMVFSGSSSISL